MTLVRTLQRMRRGGVAVPFARTLEESPYSGGTSWAQCSMRSLYPSLKVRDPPVISESKQPSASERGVWSGPATSPLNRRNPLVVVDCGDERADRTSAIHRQV
jgi:hypothetical protein